MAAISGAGTSPPEQQPALSREDQTLLLFAGLMEGGKEDDETVRDLDLLTKVLNADVEATKKDGEASICPLIDADCVDTLLGYLDMRQPDVVRGHATLTTSSYLRAAGDDGAQKLSAFFMDRVRRGTYDDYIVAFCVAAAVFPIVPDLTAQMFLAEGFLPSLGPLMRRKWKSRKVETACLDMLNVACMNAACREAVQKYCVEWLEEIVDQDPDDVVKDMFAANPDGSLGEGSISMRRHSVQVQNLAAVILAKIKATLPPQQTPKLTEIREDGGDSGRVEPATTSIEDLSKMFTSLLVDSPDDEHGGGPSAVEGLAYASLQPRVREDLAGNGRFLASLVKTLKDAPPRSPVTYGALSIFSNLTRYQPPQSEEQKRLGQLKAYADAANAGGKQQQQPSSQQQPNDPLSDDEHVAARCQKVFAAGVTPVLVTHSKNGSAASLALIIGIIHALSVTPALRGQLAQQGAVHLLTDAWNSLASEELAPARRAAAQALARILISTNPAHVFGGTRPTPMSAAIRPLASLLRRDDEADRDLLPAFESLMALTNLASTDDATRGGILRAAWPDVEEQVLSSNARVARAAVELVCNLVQGPDGAQLYADDTSPQARNRLNILVALADAEDAGTRNAAGGALAALLAYEGAVAGVVARPRGVAIVLGLCAASESEDLRHRGAVAVYSMVSCEGETGRRARAAVRAADGVAVLTECAKASRRPEVVEAAVYALKALLEEEEE